MYFMYIWYLYFILYKYIHHTLVILIILLYNTFGDIMIKVIKNGTVVTIDEKRNKKYEILDIVISDDTITKVTKEYNGPADKIIDATGKIVMPGLVNCHTHLGMSIFRCTNDGYLAVCRNPFLDKAVELGYYSTPEKAFQAYKVYKEDIIKQVAEVEYKAGNITEECYQAMIRYEVEIDD